MTEWNYNLDEIPLKQKKGFEILATREDGEVTMIQNYNSNERLPIPIIAWMPMPEPAKKQKHCCLQHTFLDSPPPPRCYELEDGKFYLDTYSYLGIGVNFCPFCGEESPAHAMG